VKIQYPVEIEAESTIPSLLRHRPKIGLSDEAIVDTQ
jgi:hypothetical protein